ncbi:exodeoxyribonuclease X [Sphingomonas zeicaulis]|uniref:exonuclease domain-containing protein n=1 Tax=Sphingomonas zeicaulis TaxID=1632740 RepID=UPI003D1CD9AA
MRLRVVDLETTGMEPPAEIVEFGYSDVLLNAGAASITPPVAWLYRPLNGIPPETMAVHHLTPADFHPEMAPATPGHMRAALAHGGAPDVLVAHNCAFERKFLRSDVTGATPWICTYKAAMHVWPDAPKHGNQVLRYWRGLSLDPALAMPPHRAGPDAWVTAHLLLELLRVASVEQMVAWSEQPRPMPTLPFGKHRGATWPDVPADYLQWMVGQDMDPDVLWHARAELARR